MEGDDFLWIKSVGAEMRNIRGSRSQEEIGGLANIPRSNISKYESSSIMPQINVLARFCKACGVKLSDFIKRIEG